MDDATFHALAAEALALQPPMSHEIRHLCREESARYVDRLLELVSHRQGALDVAIGEALDALGGGDSVFRLGFSSIGDYARERLGMAGSTAQKMARLARELRDRPALRDALWLGQVTARKAQVLLPVARGDAQQSWVARARTETVRALQAAVKAAMGHAEPDQDECWERICVPISPDQRSVLEEAMALAGKVVGSTAPKWERLEVLCQEFIGAHPAGDECAEGGVLYGTVDDWLQPTMEWLEQETGRWSLLERSAPVPAPVPEEPVMDDPWLLDGRLRELSAQRAASDEVVGRLALVLRMCGLWRDLGFASFAHYCVERLGMSPRAVEQRVALERRLSGLPSLRQAMREGRISYEKARLVASRADDTTVDQLVAAADGMTCIALRRELDRQGEAQMCARGELDLRVPARVRVLLETAFSAARRAAGVPLSAGECLRMISQHFIDTWGPALRRRSTRQQKVVARDGGLCQVPGCSRAAAHAHHVRFRSRGGADDLWNLVSLCAVHHLQGVHQGWIRVSGKAPDGLRWELGVRPGAPPLLGYPAGSA